MIIGAGFSGLYMLHKLRNQMGLTRRVFEAGGGVGGTWYWNRYPGARSDSDSYIYGFTFDEELWQEWEWSERYPEQHEIRAYLEHVAERFDLYPDITFDTRVTGATFDEDTDTWTVTTDTGETVTARYLITAVGALSASNTPTFPGLDTFARRDLPHRPVAARDGRLHRQAGRRHRHRRQRGAGDPADRQRGQRPHGLPAHGQLHHPGPQRPGARGRREARKADYAGIRERIQNSPFGFELTTAGEGRAGVHRRGDRAPSCEQRWDEGGFGIWLGGYVDMFFVDEANAKVRDFLHEQDPGEGRRPGDRRAADPQGLSVRRQAQPARLRLLRDVQPAARAPGRREGQPDRRDHRRPG